MIGLGFTIQNVDFLRVMVVLKSVVVVAVEGVSNDDKIEIVKDSHKLILIMNRYYVL